MAPTTSTPSPAPLVQFTDRLFFTTFNGAIPSQQALNASHGGGRQRVPIALRRPSPSIDDNTAKYYFFTIDNSLNYLSFFEDWGPLNLANVFRACILIHELLQDQETVDHGLVLYSSSDPRRKANAALLMALYVMIVMRRPPWEAFNPIADMEFMPFRDAGRARPDFNLSIQDCLWGVWKAMQNGLCDMNQFSLEEYEYYEKVENGDWNWITPGFIAFASPVDSAWMQKQTDGSTSTTSTKGTALQRRLPTPYLNCLEYFEKKNVKIVIRLNQPLYDRQTFLDRGIDHMELYFDDGTNPTDEIVRKFIQVSDPIISKGGVVAVHCKAGLGRTGTLIGAYLIWKYGFTANEAIAFMRIVRPGSVVGPQQHFMYLKQLEWNKWSAVDEVRRQGEAEVPTVPVKEGRRATPEPVIDAKLPPVTPSRHVLATTAAVQNIANPPQPRKTPRKKDPEAMDEDKEVEDAVPPLPPPMKPLIPRPGHARKPSTRTGNGTGPSVVNSTSIVNTTATNMSAPTRKTRSATAAQNKQNPSTSAKAADSNRIPRLTRSKDTNSTMTTRSRAAGGPPPSRTPSRLPTLVPAKRSYVVLEADSGAESGPTEREPASPIKGKTVVTNTGTKTSRRKSAGAKLKLVDDTPVTNEWIHGEEANAVVVPGSKLERPLLRSVKRRRSSFSSVDIIA